MSQKSQSSYEALILFNHVDILRKIMIGRQNHKFLVATASNNLKRNEAFFKMKNTIVAKPMVITLSIRYFLRTKSTQINQISLLVDISSFAYIVFSLSQYLVLTRDIFQVWQANSRNFEVCRSIRNICRLWFMSIYF